MLVDVKIEPVDSRIAMILGLVGGSGDPTPQRIGGGMYLCTHWNFENYTPVRERWREDPPSWLPIQEYGVCDTPEQAVQKLGLRDLPERYVISFVRIRRDEQPADGGWRWHKWGDYIGDHEPQCEYLHDEPEIEEVYTFHVYEPATSTTDA